MAKDFVSFDEALRHLCVSEAMLKALVSNGHIRCFREGDQMKFKASDVEKLAEEGFSLVMGTAIVHGLGAGWPLCKFTSKVPRDWPDGHAWVSASKLEQITCPQCQEATYVSNPTAPVPAMA